MKQLKNILLTALTALCVFMFTAQVEQRIRIEKLESTVSNQKIELQHQEKENKSLNDLIDALNIKVDKLPK